MHIGVITTSYPRQADDPAGNFVAAHVDWMRARGHHIDVICAADARAPHTSWQPGVSITAVPAPAGLFYAGGAPEALDAALARAVPGAARFCLALAAAVAARARRWDAMVAHWLVPSAMAAALAPSTAPLLAIAHSGDVHLARRLGITTPLAALLCARRARVAFVSHALRQGFLDRTWPAALEARLARASQVTPMGLDMARFRAVRARRGHALPAQETGQETGPATGQETGQETGPATGQETGQKTGPATGQEPHLPHVLFLGRLVPIKGAHVLLDAVAELEARDLTLRVTLAGHGPDRPALERRARALRTHIVFAGEVRGARRDDLLAQADLLVAPSVPVSHHRTEGMPMAVLEAMATGVPVVASRAGGLAELPESTAVLVQPGDPHALAAGIQRCLDDPLQRERRVAAATALADDLDWDRVGARLCAGWSDLST